MHRKKQHIGFGTICVFRYLLGVFNISPVCKSRFCKNILRHTNIKTKNKSKVQTGQDEEAYNMNEKGAPFS